MHYSITFSDKTVQYLLNSRFTNISELVIPKECIIITDSNVARIYGESFSAFKAVVGVIAGEEHKTIESILKITQQLLEHEAHRKTILIGVGGGMITDITGAVASLYMRGIKFGYVPTTLLGMVDASIGGKNGVNFKKQKNLLGTFNQPEFILFDTHFLQTLTDDEWSNGFAEVIKYACLFDKKLFDELSENDINHYKNDNAALSSIVAKCVDWKNKIVLADERESGMRKLLNFGHTVGHAIETVHNTSHGHAVALGMIAACKLSEQKGLDKNISHQLVQLLQQYNLPTNIDTDVYDLIQVLRMDKKRTDDGIDFILLKDIGDAYIETIDEQQIKNAIEIFTNASDY